MADRVIILDVRRGHEELRPRDVKQMFGRAGRTHGVKKSADVHILVPHDLLDSWQQKINDPASYEVRSYLNRPLAMSFHVISHVVNGEIHDRSSFYEWYERTFDCLQRKTRNEPLPVYENIAEELHKTGTALYDETTKTLRSRPLGRVCTRFYFSPQDVRDWFVNWSRLVERNLLHDDVCQAWALASVTSIVTWETKTITTEAEPLCEHVTDLGLAVRRGTTPRLLAVHYVLSGKRPRCELPEFFTVKGDLSRVIEATAAIFDCARNLWGPNVELVETLKKRLKYGVPSFLVPLVSLEGVGKTTARELREMFDVSDGNDLVKKQKLVRNEGSPSAKRALTRFLKFLSSTPENVTKISSARPLVKTRDEFEEVTSK